MVQWLGLGAQGSILVRERRSLQAEQDSTPTDTPRNEYGINQGHQGTGNTSGDDKI